MPKLSLLLLTLGFAVSLSPARAQMLEAVRKEGRMPCGVIESVDDWNGRDQHGDLSRFGTEICGAVATAILGDPHKAVIVHFPAEPEALAALKDGGIALAVGMSPSIDAAARYHVAFGRPVYLDSLRFMVAKASGLHAIADLRDKLICAMDSTASERSLQDLMAARKITFGLQSHSEQGEMDASVGVAHCNAGVALESRLAESRADFPANAPEFVMLPERIGVDPVTPAWRYGDQTFGLIVEATIDALIEAEALGINKENVNAERDRHDLRADRLLGHDHVVGQALGLTPDWAVHVIAAVGNYGEIFDQTIGKPLRLERGYNALWTNGGLLYPYPLD